MNKVQSVIYATADELGRNRPAVMNGKAINQDDWNLWVNILISLADRFENFDPKFNRLQFLYSCGYLDSEESNGKPIA